MVVLSHIECQMKSLPKFINFKTRTIIVLNSFNGWQLLFVDQVYKFLWTVSFVGNFLDFLIKEWTFSSLNHFLKLFPIFQLFWRPISFKVSITASIPPTLGMFGNVDDLWVFGLYSFYSISKRLNRVFKRSNIRNSVYVNCSNSFG